MAGKHPKNDLSFFFRDNLPHFLETNKTPGAARRKRQMALQNELWQFELVQFPQKFIPCEVRRSLPLDTSAWCLYSIYDFRGCIATSHAVLLIQSSGADISSANFELSKALCGMLPGET